ncbi:Rpn family recombination-promoting nuclease/putative transposase [Leptothoe sp. LEGE 181152]|uniref:Rpn family recombination-promoting nuclease/putative transposase n=1 Tax=Adonisia turfae CCMR0081 TaxID=2292702 RepID=A0A6M0RWJ7_9CYAN|nr:Rpn family recombination-promoting nuclease/putative transposase [Adonisia turfae]MDV3353410.1 Rpn family recombination-promoting nuclease/putative transposase [Leptothoe sp. LEGE 181152]NEZ60605.1 Rpn family recombination-promoting nuclease/putative transposase [Adonisia turfae CCMR0081]
MAFINPKTDFAFKKIFGSEEHKDILMSFLNGMVYEGNDIVQDLTILNPYQAPRIRGVKDTYLDVKAQLHDGSTVIIEMQVLNLEGFEKRILYNAAKAYSIQLNKGHDYALLNPVIALTITDFVMFPEFEGWLSRFILKEKNFLFDYPIHDLELVFGELPKFDRALDELHSLTDQWAYFLNHARELETIPESLRVVTAIKEAFNVANQANLTREELDDLEHQEMFIQDQRGAIVKASKQALEQGLQQGMERGQQQTQLDIARRLLPMLDDDAISQTTGLLIEEIQQLRQE